MAELLHGMLTVDRETRMSAAEVLAHPWIGGEPRVKAAGGLLSASLSAWLRSSRQKSAVDSAEGKAADGDSQSGEAAADEAAGEAAGAAGGGGGGGGGSSLGSSLGAPRARLTKRCWPSWRSSVSIAQRCLPRSKRAHAMR